MTEGRDEAIAQWIKDHAYDPHDFVLGHTTIEGQALAELAYLLDLVLPGWRSLFAAVSDD